MDAVFTAAARTTQWTTTTLGPRTEVTHDGYTWTVELPAAGHGSARITGRHGYGGVDLLHTEATPGQTIAIVEAAQSALRATVTPAPGWRTDDDGEQVGNHPTEEDAKAQARTLLLSGRHTPDQISVIWECPQCPDGDPCADCDAGRRGLQVAYLQLKDCPRVLTAYSVRPTA